MTCGKEREAPYTEIRRNAFPRILRGGRMALKIVLNKQKHMHTHTHPQKIQTPKTQSHNSTKAPRVFFF